VIVTIGTFDGVHLGHQAVLRQAREKATASGLPLVAYTFGVPPRRDAGEPAPPGLLLSRDLKERLLRGWADRVVWANFAEVGLLSAGRFVEEVLARDLGARGVVVGEAFRFGRGRQGDARLLRRLAEGLGIVVTAVPSVRVGGAAVSSSEIRRLVRAGRVGEARALLGRPPILAGPVVHGDGIGKGLGYPTANLSLDPEVLLPADGIYLVRAFLAGRGSPGLLYVGERPTVAGTARRCEVYLLEPPQEGLYEKVIEVHVLERIRDDRAFASLEALRRQIDRDVAGARALLATSEEDSRPVLP